MYVYITYLYIYELVFCIYTMFIPLYLVHYVPKYILPITQRILAHNEPDMNIVYIQKTSTYIYIYIYIYMYVCMYTMYTYMDILYIRYR